MKRFRIVGPGALCLALAGPMAAAPAQQVEAGRTLLYSDPKTDVVSAALSPDGSLLVVARLDASGRSSLWLLRTGTDTPQRLTSDGYWDSNPEWSPAGDVLYFVSNRGSSDHQQYVGMAINVHVESGRALGEPRRVTPDPVVTFVRVSPDGGTLAYLDAGDRRSLKTVPASGGSATVVAQLPQRSGNVVWSRDGSALYFVTNIPDQSARVLHRVAAAGGAIDEVTRALPLGRLVLGRGAEMIVAEENGEGPRERLLRLVNQSGTVVRTLTVNRNTRTAHVSADGRRLVLVESNVVAPTRVMSIAGGDHRDVTPPITYDWVMGFTPDGAGVYTWTERNGQTVLAEVPLAGGEPKFHGQRPGWNIEGANRRYLFETSRRDGTRPRSLSAMDWRDGSRHVISQTLPGHNMTLAYGPGGTWGVHDELYYFERRDDRLEVKAWRAPGDVRTLRSLPISLLGRTNVAVHGDLVAWQEPRGDSLDLMIADSPNAAPRRLLSGAWTPGTNEISFSHDGRLLALHYSRGPGSPDLMAIVDVAGAAPRIIDTGLSYWYWPRWLPDNSGVLVIGGGVGAEANVALVRASGDGRAVNVTAGDPASKWGFEVSPDGLLIAYPGEVWQGSSIWTLNVPGG